MPATAAPIGGAELIAAEWGGEAPRRKEGSGAEAMIPSGVGNRPPFRGSTRVGRCRAKGGPVLAKDERRAALSGYRV